MIFEHTSYRTYLKSILAEKQGRNPGYSLRALARDLDINPSHLSAIHKGNKNLSSQSAVQVAKRLGLSNVEAEYFVLLVQLESAGAEEIKETILQRLNTLNGKIEVVDLDLDSFKVISDWYHIPILEMTGMSHFELTPRSISKRLGITPAEAEAAIERLMRLGLLEKNSKGKFIKSVKNYVFKSQKPNAALRRFHHEMLKKAQESLEKQVQGERYIGSQTFAIDVSQLEEATKIIEDFRKKMVELFNQGKKRTETYHLGVQLFNLTKGETKK